MIFRCASSIIHPEYLLSTLLISGLIKLRNLFSHAVVSQSLEQWVSEFLRRFIIPLYNEGFSLVELLSQLLHNHLLAGLLVDAGLAAILAAAVVGGGTSCGNNLHFKL